MSATFDYFGFMPPDLRKHFATVEDFVGELDGKMLCSPTDGDTLIDEGTVDAEEAVKAINAIATTIKQIWELGEPPVDLVARTFLESERSYERREFDDFTVARLSEVIRRARVDGANSIKAKVDHLYFVLDRIAKHPDARDSVKSIAFSELNR